MFRQGDVLVVPVDYVPKDASLQKGEVILAHGEVTGHAHRIRHKFARVLEKDGRRYLRLPKEAVLEHEEHEHLTIPKGEYEVIIQREYSPEAIRNVAD